MILEKKEAISFFADIYGGEHHFPNELKSWGEGWAMKDHSEMATWDFDRLTRLVVLGHDRNIRVGISPFGMKAYVITLHKRQATTDLMTGHPTIEQAIERVRNYKIFSK